jgi:hypothetical protein
MTNPPIYLNITKSGRDAPWFGCIIQGDTEFTGQDYETPEEAERVLRLDAAELGLKGEMMVTVDQ